MYHAASHSSLHIAALKARERLGRAGAAPGGRPCPPLEWRPLPVARPWDFPVAAVDGGSVTLEGAYHTFYAAKSWGGLFEPGERGLVSSRLLAHVGLVLPPRYVEERVSLYREILEAEAGLLSLPERGGLLLMDGSIKPVARPGRLGGLGHPREETLASVAERISRLIESGGLDKGAAEELRGLCPAFWGRCLRRFLEAPGIPRPASSELVLRLLGECVDWAPVLETLERLTLYRMLVEEAWRRGTRVVFVTKSSRQDSLCGGPYSDVHYIRMRVPFDTGYAVWPGGVRAGVFEVTGLDAASIGEYYLPALGLREFYFQRLGLVEFYLRLSPGGPILMVDVVVDASIIPGEGEARLEFARAQAEEVISMLKALPGSRAGYPSALVIAHRAAVLGREERMQVESILGLTGEIPDRSMLMP